MRPTGESAHRGAGQTAAGSRKGVFAASLRTLAVFLMLFQLFSACFERRSLSNEKNKGRRSLNRGRGFSHVLYLGFL